MLIKTGVNRLVQFKGFVVGKICFCGDGKRIDIEMVARKNSRPVCRRYGKNVSGHFATSYPFRKL